MRSSALILVSLLTIIAGNSLRISFGDLSIPVCPSGKDSTRYALGPRVFLPNQVELSLASRNSNLQLI